MGSTRPVLALALLLVAPALAGCTQPPTGDGTDDGMDGNGPADVTVTVSLENVTRLVETGEPVRVEWRVDTSTGEQVEIPHTAVHYARSSVADPQAPGDYGNTSGAREPATVPGTFDTRFTTDQEGSLFLRAHAIHDGTHVWSDEVEVTVQREWDPTIHTIDIGNNTPGIQADYDPSGLEIEVGDGIKWVNRDPTPMIEHTATSMDDAPASFDTGNLAQGEESQVFYFNTTGTYAYFCQVHGADNMRDEFTVVEAG